MQKKKKNSVNHLDFKNPFILGGFVLMIIGVIGGGAIGGALGGLSWAIISKIGSNKTFSNSKKIIFSILITLGGILLYFVAVITLLPLFK
jgi:hypothetical protein